MYQNLSNHSLRNKLFLLPLLFALLALLVPIPYIAAYEGGESQEMPALPYGDRPNIESSNAPRQTLAAAFTSHDCTLNTGNPITNCSFESGDFTGWVTQDLTVPLTPLNVVGAGYMLWHRQRSWVRIF